MTTFQGVSYNSIAAIGKSWLLFKWNLVKRIFAMTLIFVGLKWGVYGILWAMVVGTYVISFINMYLVSSQIGYNLGKQFRDIIPIVLIATSSATVISSRKLSAKSKKRWTRRRWGIRWGV